MEMLVSKLRAPVAAASVPFPGYVSSSLPCELNQGLEYIPFLPPLHSSV